MSQAVNENPTIEEQTWHYSRIPAPRLSSEFESPDDTRSQEQLHADALRFLARQLGVANDFYFPLLGAAQMLDGKNAKVRERELQQAAKAAEVKF